MMQQFQIKKTDQSVTRLVDLHEVEVTAGHGEIVVQIERFGFSANNVTYAVAGDTLNYWQFFPTVDDVNDEWGVLPVWGFAEVVQSNIDSVDVGERLFGYFPPAHKLKMKPAEIAEAHFFDSSAHRLELPKGYNLYRRVKAEPASNLDADNLRMLLYPLYVTAFCIWDQMVEFDWYNAEQIITISASSKTSIGLGYALKHDGHAPKTVGLTSASNKPFVEGLELYDSVVSYLDILDQIKNIPSIIVDMAGNGELLGDLHTLLGENMHQTISVGLTHWNTERRDSRVVKDRTAFFFAPSRIQTRMKEWGADVFGEKSGQFAKDAAANSSKWLDLQNYNRLDQLNQVYNVIREGKAKPDMGILFEL